MSTPDDLRRDTVTPMQQRLSTQAVHVANASASLGRVEQLHLQLATEIAALREHLSKAAGG